MGKRTDALERRVAYLEEQMRNICRCRWADNDGPRLDTNELCLIHAPKYDRVITGGTVTHGPPYCPSCQAYHFGVCWNSGVTT